MLNAKGLKTVLFDGLENTQEVERIASNYDRMEDFVPEPCPICTEKPLTTQQS